MSLNHNSLFIIRNSSRRGQLSLELIIFAAVGLILITGFASWTESLLNLSLRDLNKRQAFMIAEAGIEYYRWHLAHNKTDYTDGTGIASSTYVHNFFDKDAKLVGSFTLTITPPPSGSTIVTVKSVGKVLADSSVSKTITVKLGISSFAKYAWVLNDNVNFGSEAEVFGPVHSNTGIHFDGIAHNLVTSALFSYDDSDHTGGNEFAVHTHDSPVDPLPVSATSVPPTRADVFMAGRQLSIPAVNFAGLTQNLAQIKADASSSGLYFASTTSFGYEVVLKTNNTFDLYRVTALMPPPANCTSSGGVSQAGWGTWTIQTKVASGTYNYPANGLIFLEDNVWVRGSVSGTRVTIASGRFPDNPATRSNIIVNSPLTYTNYDGTDVVSLVAQKHINVGLVSSSTLRIDGALIAQNGRVGRYSYNSFCGSTRLRTLLISYGMLGTNLRPAFYYGSSGYQSRQYIYDANLLYGPPPSYPLTSDQYSQISWEETQ